ncbi:MAG: class B sortase [Clostridia bacterium]|nr:class B sortase [Clostridia bacterium]
MKKKIIISVLWIIAIVTLAFGVVKGVVPAVREQIEVRQAKKQADELEKKVRYRGSAGESEGTAAVDPDFDLPDGYFGVDHNAMKAVEPQYCGWLFQNGTISLPVVYSPDDDSYWLKHDIYGNRTDVGTPFCYGKIDFEKPTQNITVYGHHFNGNDWLMFGPLMGYKNADYLKEHPTFIFDTPFGVYEYRVFSVFNCLASDSAKYGRSAFSSEEEFYRFAEDMKGRSLYDTGVIVKGNDSILTLSTCDRTYDWENGRLVVTMVRAGEDLTESVYGK